MKSFLPILLFTATSLLAQSQTVSEEIVVTASALPERSEVTPAAATIITRAQIEQREARDVADVLREVPGLTVSRTGSPGKVVSLFVRGGSSKQALVLWNGVEMNNPYFSGYNFGQLSTAGVEKVEVVRGPFSALYGSDAVSGVVNVLTSPARDGVSVDLAAGTDGLLNAAATASVARTAWSAHGTFEHRQDDGFADNDDFRSDSILAGATFRPSQSLSLGILGRYSTYDLGIPFNANAAGTAFEPSPVRGEDGSEAQIAIPITLTAGRVDYELRLAENHRQDHFEDERGPFGPTESDTDSRTRSARATARTKTSFGTITIGGEVERSVVDHQSDFNFIDSRDRSNRSFFLEDRFSLQTRGGSFELSAGLRHDHFDTFGSELSPRVAAAFVRGNGKWRAAYGEGFRAPGIGELYSQFFGNPDLGAERSRSLEAGYDHYFGRGASVSVTLFRSEYDDLINFGFTSNRFENIESATAQGVEFGASRRFGNLTTAISYTWLDTEDEATGLELVRRPEHSGSFALGYDFAPFGAQLVVIHSGERADVTDLVPYGRVTNEAYTTADFTLHYDLGALRPFVKVENLTGEQYEEVFGYRSGGRRAVIGVRWAR